MTLAEHNIALALSGGYGAERPPLHLTPPLWRALISFDKADWSSPSMSDKSLEKILLDAVLIFKWNESEGPAAIREHRILE